MTHALPQFRTRLASTAADLRAAQHLRYRVFVDELGASGTCVDHRTATEADAFDAHSDHLMLEDLSRPHDPVVGVYRVMTAAQAVAAGGFSAAAEFDLTPLLTSGRPLLELGRSCLLPDYRGGPGMMHLFAGLARHVAPMPGVLLFGLASFHGTDAAALTAPLAYLGHTHLAPPHLRTRPIGPGALPLPRAEAPDRKAALRAVPPLIKTYLRLGGVVGDGACIDAGFNTTDVCMILDTAAMTEGQRARFAPGSRA
ncbi:GNAT family N-acetyltransferase [Loktanella sp. M215]|uniref:GNAT family N-acetyltransferase n=1 Tax=Loktanella sp. M215 TaxID=2675431 RepID=UPI001F167517|nr:GNAT family N-acyltransferase [Loktanella sp. M215]MCF7700701.1 GNAT family N-acetyltransferase [Loktanella sp. M215]